MRSTSASAAPWASTPDPARPLGYRATADDTPAAIERLLRGYLAARSPEEDLRAYFARTSDDDLRAQLNGAPTAPVTRDEAPAGGRHAVDA